MIISRRVITAKIEVTQGSDVAPTPAADAVKVENPAFSWVDPRMFEPASVKPAFGAEQAIYGGALGQLTFDVLLKGSGTAGTAPEVDALLRACGLAVTNVPATSDTYAPVSTGQESVSIYYYDDGKLTKLLGAMGNVTFEMPAGNPVKASFTMTGHVVDPVDTALPTPTFNATVPPVYNNASFTTDSFAAKISALSFDLGNEMAKPEDVSGTDGWGDMQIVDRIVAGSFDPFDTLIADYDWVTKWQANTLAAIASGAVGATAGNIINFSFPTAQYREFSDADREKIKTLKVGFTAVESTGDDEFSIAFT